MKPFRSPLRVLRCMRMFTPHRVWSRVRRVSTSVTSYSTFYHFGIRKENKYPSSFPMLQYCKIYIHIFPFNSRHITFTEAILISISDYFLSHPNYHHPNHHHHPFPSPPSRAISPHAPPIHNALLGQRSGKAGKSDSLSFPRQRFASSITWSFGERL